MMFGVLATIADFVHRTLGVFLAFALGFTLLWQGQLRERVQSLEERVDEIEARTDELEGRADELESASEADWDAGEEERLDWD